MAPPLRCLLGAVVVDTLFTMKLPLLEASLDEVIDLFLFTQVTGKMIVAIEGLYQDIVFIYRHIFNTEVCT